jgi:hypothetical protein
LGHNYRLGHARDPREDGNDPYGDMTGHMGGGSETKRCYNGYNYFVLGWHGTQTNEIEVSSLSAGSARTYNLKGIDDISTGGVVNIKVGEYYITYNLKQGINEGNDFRNGSFDYPNEVIIHQGQDIQFGQTTSGVYFTTSLVSNLGSPGDDYQVNNFNGGNLVIELCTIDQSGTAGTTLSIGLDAGCAGAASGSINNPQTMQTLQNGVAVSGLSAPQDEVIEFEISVPPGASSVTCTTSGGTGDADLLINFLSTPMILFEDEINTCFSWTNGNTESCSTTDIKADTLYIALHAYSSFSGVTLKCTVVGGTPVPPTPPPTPAPVIPSAPTNAPTVSPPMSSVLQSGIPVQGLSGESDDTFFWTMPMPANAESVSCSMSGGSGDADLFVRWDNEVDLSNNGNNAVSCALNCLSPFERCLTLALLCSAFRTTAVMMKLVMPTI